MPVIYRKLTYSDCWHFHDDCRHMRRVVSHWPSRLIIRAVKPRSGEMCNECQAKARADKRKQKRG